VTDANLILGRIQAKYFPKIFGKTQDQPLFEEETRMAFEELTGRINQETGRKMTIHEVAYGFIEVANESMCRPIRSLTQGKGFDQRDHILRYLIYSLFLKKCKMNWKKVFLEVQEHSTLVLSQKIWASHQYSFTNMLEFSAQLGSLGPI
jgi:hypothetical protein